MITELNQINTNTEDGKMLLAAIAKITGESQTDKTPNEVIQQIKSLADTMYPNKPTGELLTIRETTKVLTEIREERQKQNRKWGEQNHNLPEWIAILTEEVGEAAKEAVDYHFKHSSSGGNAPNDELQMQRLKNYRKECIQVAAVAVQMVESLDRSTTKQ